MVLHLRRFDDRLVSQAALSLTMLVVGCTPSDRPALGRVTGTVTLDGNPLANASVRFTPRGPGRTSEGTTDRDGRYQLRYLRDILGADIDHHAVRITTSSEENGGRELLPPRYHARSRLEAEILPGTNRIDFQLRSDGR